MSVARKVVGSTVQGVVEHIAEIVMSIVLLVVICLPLAYVVPMWIQHVAFGVPFSELAINPVAWFGTGGAVFLILLLTAVSLILGYIYLSKMTPGPEVAPVGEKKVPEEEQTEEEELEIEAETLAEEIEEVSEAEALSEGTADDDRGTSELED